MTEIAGEASIAAAIEAAETLHGLSHRLAGGKPRLEIDHCNPDVAVAALRDILAGAGGLFERAWPVRLVYDKIQGETVAQPVTPDSLIFLAHSACRPFAIKQRQDGTTHEVDARLPRSLAVMYLDWRGEWRLPVLNGIASAPLLRDDGTLYAVNGYDPLSGLWLDNVPDLSVPERPTRQNALDALMLIRRTFATFCFADSITATGQDGIALVDVAGAPGRDESTFLNALLTAVCRPSLPLAPGILLRAPPISGAGAGKGLLARCVSLVAFGKEPHAVTAGGNPEELDKRVAAELIAGSPTLFLDNLNNTAVRSDLLASAITERTARVRLLGKSQMMPLNTSALVILTGNGVSVSEDLARRFIAVEFDPRTEEPEARPFRGDIRAEVKARRSELLAALLTIWRWGRRSEGIVSGQALGSFERWCRWVRDPLLALGCRDPAERISEAKARDGRRQTIVELFGIWWDRHGDRPVAVRALHDDVRQAADPQNRGRQYLAAQLEKLAGTRMAGFMLTRQSPAGKWGVATYSLVRTGDPAQHRGHRGHEPGGASDAPDAPDASDGANGMSGPRQDDLGRRDDGTGPKPPMPPMPSGPRGRSDGLDQNPPDWSMRL